LCTEVSLSVYCGGLGVILLKQFLSLVVFLSYFLIDLVWNPLIPRESTSYWYGLGIILLVDLIYISNPNANCLVPLRESLESNFPNENLSVLSKESLVETTLFILKVLLLLLYYFRFKWWSCFYALYTSHQNFFNLFFYSLLH